MEKFLAELESLGESKVHERLLLNPWLPPYNALAEEWLKLKVRVREEARAEESLLIARRALLNSRMATVIALAVAAFSARVEIVAFMKWAAAIFG